MRWDRLGCKSVFLTVVVILLAPFLMLAKVNAGICYNPNLPTECSDASGASSCINGQIYSINDTCVEVQAAADLIENAKDEAAGKILKNKA